MRPNEDGLFPRPASGRKVFARPLYLRRLDFTANQASTAVIIPQGGRMSSELI